MENISTENTTIQQSVTKNNVDTKLNMFTANNINGSLHSNNQTMTDQSVKLNMSSSTDTYNVDQSTINNVTTESIVNNMIKMKRSKYIKKQLNSSLKNQNS